MPRPETRTEYLEFQGDVVQQNTPTPEGRRMLSTPSPVTPSALYHKGDGVGADPWQSGDVTLFTDGAGVSDIYFDPTYAILVDQYGSAGAGKLNDSPVAEDFFLRLEFTATLDSNITDFGTFHRSIGVVYGMTDAEWIQPVYDNLHTFYFAFQSYYTEATGGFRCCTLFHRGVVAETLTIDIDVLNAAGVSTNIWWICKQANRHRVWLGGIDAPQYLVIDVEILADEPAGNFGIAVYDNPFNTIEAGTTMSINPSNLKIWTEGSGTIPRILATRGRWREAATPEPLPCPE